MTSIPVRSEPGSPGRESMLERMGEVERRLDRQIERLKSDKVVVESGLADADEVKAMVFSLRDRARRIRSVFGRQLEADELDAEIEILASDCADVATLAAFVESGAGAEASLEEDINRVAADMAEIRRVLRQTP